MQVSTTIGVVATDAVGRAHALASAHAPPDADVRARILDLVDRAMRTDDRATRRELGALLETVAATDPGSALTLNFSGASPVQTAHAALATTHHLPTIHSVLDQARLRASGPPGETVEQLADRSQVVAADITSRPFATTSPDERRSLTAALTTLVALPDVPGRTTQRWLSNRRYGSLGEFTKPVTQQDQTAIAYLWEHLRTFAQLDQHGAEPLGNELRALLRRDPTTAQAFARIGALTTVLRDAGALAPPTHVGRTRLDAALYGAIDDAGEGTDAITALRLAVHGPPEAGDPARVDASVRRLLDAELPSDTLERHHLAALVLSDPHALTRTGQRVDPRHAAEFAAALREPDAWHETPLLRSWTAQVAGTDTPEQARNRLTALAHGDPRAIDAAQANKLPTLSYLAQRADGPPLTQQVDNYIPHRSNVVERFVPRWRIETGGTYALSAAALENAAAGATHLIRRSEVAGWLEGSVWPHTTFHGSTNRDTWEKITTSGADTDRNKRSTLGRGFYAALQPGDWGLDIHETAIRSERPFVIDGFARRQYAEVTDATDAGEIHRALLDAGYDSVLVRRPGAAEDWLIGLRNDGIKIVVADDDALPDARPPAPSTFAEGGV